MQHRFLAAGIVCLMVAGPAWAQGTSSDQTQNTQQATTTDPNQSPGTSSVGGVTDTRSQYGARHVTEPCTYRPKCDIFFGN